MKITDDFHKSLKATVAAMQAERRPFWGLWQELANFYLPKRYVWLNNSQQRIANAKNPYILDPTGTDAARTLAAGMMNGITSPSRPWFSVRLAGFDMAQDDEAQRWCDEVTRRILLVMAESNYYNALAIMYLDLVVFGSAAMLIYEDYDSTIRCYNPALGEFYFGQDHRLSVNRFAREFTLNVNQVVSQFGEENCSETVRGHWQAGGARLLQPVELVHIIEPNDDGKGSIPKRFRYREVYYEKAAPEGQVLSASGFRELPGIFPRWELTANDSYGTSPAMDALPDVIQLQFETRKKAQGIDKQINPPVIADVQLQHKPTALMANGVSYVAGVNNVGVKPVYNVAPPLQDLTMDIRDVQARIKQTFHNDLFLMISQLDTVRSAAEIGARREEKLVLLGSVLERFENEALDPSINRIFSIMNRAGLIPPAPESIQDADIEIQYVSILSTAQRAVQAAPMEQWLAMVGNIGSLVPEVLDIPDWEEAVRNYGQDIGVQARNMRTRDETAARRAQREEQLAAQEAAATGEVLVDSAKQLSETQVGGGANALQHLLGG